MSSDLSFTETRSQGSSPIQPDTRPATRFVHQEADEEFSQVMTDRSGVSREMVNPEPNENVPHVEISLALEEDQDIDFNEWENWIGAFPAIAKYVKVQGVFKSH
jgi:hypothetical protein